MTTDHELPAFKVKKVKEFGWEPYDLADGGQSDTMLGSAVYWPFTDSEAHAWARFFERAFPDHYEVTLVDEVDQT